MNLLELFQEPQEAYVREGRIWGVVIGVVTNNQDPDELNRVKVRFPWLSDEDESHWARVLTPMAGKDLGSGYWRCYQQPGP